MDIPKELQGLYNSGDNGFVSAATMPISRLIDTRAQSIMNQFATNGMNRSGIQGAVLNDLYAKGGEQIGNTAIQAKDSMLKNKLGILSMLLQNQQYEDSQPGWGELLGQLLGAGAQVGSAALIA